MKNADEKIATAVGLLMSARAATDAAMKLLQQLDAPVAASDPEKCEHPGDQRRMVETMGGATPQEVCGACGAVLT